MKAQLPQTTKTPEPYLHNTNWAMQQKVDGWRCLLSCGENGVETFNRNGEPLNIASIITDYFSQFTTNWVFDGEFLNNKYYIFDLLEIPTGDIRKWEFSRRYEMLTMLSNKFPDFIQLVPIYIDNKEEGLAKLRQSSAEGVVFKRLDAPYIENKTNSQLKYKFIKQVDCVVLDVGVENKDNLLLGMYDGSKFIEVGKCSSLTGDGPNVTKDAIVQVDILYVTKGNRLYQPVKPKLRFDKNATECLVDQLEEYKTSKEVVSH